MKLSLILLGAALWATPPVQVPSKFSGHKGKDIVYQGLTEDFVPFNYQEDGDVKGSATEVAKEAFKRAKLKVSFAVWPWARAYKAALEKPKHFVYSTSRTQEREKLFKWVGPIVKDEVHLACLEGADFAPHPDFTTFKSHTVAGQYGDAPIEFLQKHGFKITIYREEDERMQAFKKGRIPLDIVTTGSQKSYETKWNVKYKKLAYLYSTDYWLAFHPSTPDAVIEALNSALESMRKDGTLKNITAKY
ncbi:substrate-binding periplasmic protein [Bdellovibrio bacteriovorus]|uniref:substrate-binding periplasmic protein n=1 Tax=Bdellovibrio bacteriovorus TaxID=959 RepID=UPI003D07B62E